MDSLRIPDPDAGRDGDPIAARPAPSDRLTLCRRGDPQRAAVERFIHDAFACTHGADIRSFMASLLTLRDQNGRLSAAVGYREAARERLFLERYLNGPVEAALAARAGAPVDRGAVVEIGNLACRDSHAARRLMLMLPDYLAGQGHLWLVFTATRPVRKILRAVRAPLIELCRAEAARVAGSGDEWGDYYDADPRVLAGYLPDARSAGWPTGEHDD